MQIVNIILLKEDLENKRRITIKAVFVFVFFSIMIWSYLVRTFVFNWLTPITPYSRCAKGHFGFAGYEGTVNQCRRAMELVEWSLKRRKKCKTSSLFGFISRTLYAPVICIHGPHLRELVGIVIFQFLEPW